MKIINQCLKDGHATNMKINKTNENFNSKVNYIMADIQKLLHQVMVNQWNVDALRFIVSSIRDKHFSIFR